MTARAPRWEIVRTDAGWHARFIASNGQKIVSSEVYARRRSAVKAIELTVGRWVATDGLNPDLGWPWPAPWPTALRDHGWIEVRDVDERTTP